jgi:cytochrome bd-type quinol oxidase subunit 1
VSGYVVAGYVVVLSVLSAYAAWVLLRGRSLERRRSPKDRR